jgi:hypothetical protein
MPLYKECKKLFIIIIIIHHHHFTLPIHPLPPTKLPPFLSPEVGMTMQKGHMKNATVFCEAVAIGRGGVSDSYPAFFLPIATTSNKNFFKV